MGLGFALVTEASHKEESQKHPHAVGEQPGGMRDGRELVEKGSDLFRRVEGRPNHTWRTNVLKELSKPPSEQGCQAQSQVPRDKRTTRTASLDEWQGDTWNVVGVGLLQLLCDWPWA